MFVFDRSALAVLAPLALLVGAVLWSNRTPPAGVAVQQSAESQPVRRDQTVAGNLPSR
jgi:uncharacterized iron-regulated membrane protein